MKLLSPTLKADELEHKKREINDAHIDDCVRDRSKVR